MIISLLEVGDSNVQCPISNKERTSRRSLLRDTILQNMIDLNLDILVPFKVKFDGEVERFPIGVQ